MLKYEIRKVFSRTGNKIALLLIALSLGVSCYFAVHGASWTNAEGESEYGIFAARNIREEKNAWSGLLTEEKIAAVIEENARIIATKEYQSESVKDRNIAYGWGQGFADIRTLIICSFCAFRDYDYYKIDALTAADAEEFYSNRILHLKEWLDTEAEEMYTEEEKEFLIERYEALETPLYYTYAGGWENLFEFAPTILMLMVLILGFLVAGIFSVEFSQKADAVFFSSYHGRQKAIRAKVTAGFLIVTCVYWTVWGSYTGIVLGILGADGGLCMIQTGLSGWKSFYNMTYLQLYVLVSVGGYVGTLFLLFLTMFVSAWTKSSAVAVVIPFALIFLPGFLANSTVSAVSKVLGVMPDQLLQMNMSVKYFNLYHVGGRIVGAAEILLVVYGALTAVLVPMVYQVYKKAGRR